MKIVRKEIIWITILFIISYLLYNPYLIFNSSETSTVDINIHDAYFVIESTNILILIIGLVFYFTYLVRMLLARFRNLIINGVFLLSNLLMIIIISSCIQIVKMIMILPGTTIYPPLSSKPKVYQGNGFENLYLFFISLLIVFIVTFILVLIKTFITIKNNKKFKIRKQNFAARKAHEPL